MPLCLRNDAKAGPTIRPMDARICPKLCGIDSFENRNGDSGVIWYGSASDVCFLGVRQYSSLLGISKE
jgi:hypothetical protein